MLVFSDRSENVRKFDRFQTIHVSWDTGVFFVCPVTQVFQRRWAITEENEIVFAQREINFTFGASPRVSRVSSDDHLVVRFHVL